jgi:hypothetical protein
LSKKPVLSGDQTKTNPVTNKNQRLRRMLPSCNSLQKTATRRSVDAVVIRGQEPGKTGRRIAMFKPFMRSAVVALALLPVAAAAEPIKLKLAFFSCEAFNRQTMEQLRADPKRTIAFPSKSDTATANAAFAAVTEEVMDGSPHPRELLPAAKSKIAGLRASE